MIILSVITLLLTAYSVYWIALKRSQRQAPLLAAWSVVLVFLASCPIVYGVRLQLMLLLGAASLMLVAHSSLDYRWRVLLYSIIFLLGSNLHGGFLILVIIPAFLETRHLSRKNWLSYSYMLSIILIAISIHPHPLDFWRLTLDYLQDNYYKAHITEWKSVFDFPIKPFSVLFPASLITFSLLAQHFWKKLTPGEYFLLICTFILGVRSIRFFPLFTLVATPYVAESFYLLIKDHFSLRPVQSFFAGTIVVWIIIHLSATNWVLLRWPSDPRHTPDYPSAALDYISNQPACQNHLYNPYEWGGYILGFYPAVHVFVDGRAPQLRINEHQTLLQVANSFKDPAEIEDNLQKYHITCVLLPTNEKDAFSNYLQHHSKWHPRFGDATARVYILEH